MQLGCTKKLLDYLGKKGGPADAGIEPLLSWSAHLITLNRRHVVVAANDSSRYGFVLYGVKAKDIKVLDQLLLDGIRACLETECISPELIDRYLSDCGESVTFTRTANRTNVARLNKLCERVAWYAEVLTPDELLQRQILLSLNYDLITNKSTPVKGYFIPFEKLAADLSARYDTPPYRCRAAELEVVLELESVCRRRIVVPLSYTFQQLHHGLQQLFCWQDYHLHEFWIERYPNGRLKYTLIGFPREDEFEGETTRMDQDVCLSEIFPSYDHIIYNYDFGDDWIHHIRLVRIVEDYDKNAPVCLAGEGDAPPEDVGGPSGYAEMLRILANPQDEEYPHIKSWLEDMCCEPFNLEQVNYGLSKSARSSYLLR
ncbi:MAG: plasmid pRiA4b ORF-3 family protein [Negativicutes bacterium]|nr:plasmid pRiA4b ORF-3 family protein [Negativicutes bacterium]